MSDVCLNAFVPLASFQDHSLKDLVTYAEEAAQQGLDVYAFMTARVLCMRYHEITRSMRMRGKLSFFDKIRRSTPAEVDDTTPRWNALIDRVKEPITEPLAYERETE